MNFKHISLALLLTLTGAQTISAQETENENKDDKYIPEKGWYVGAGFGLQFGTCTYRSFSDTSNDFGGRFIGEGGYRFSKYFSLGLSLSYATLYTTPMDCECYTSWLSPVEGYYYSADQPSWQQHLKGGNNEAKTNVFRLLLSPSVNVLAFFQKDRSRWALDLTPQCGIMNTKTTHSGIQSEGRGFMSYDYDSQWHFAYGGEASLAYSVSNFIQLRLYGAITYMTGDRFDNVPKEYHLASGPIYSDDINPHYENFIYDGGIKITYNF